MQSSLPALFFWRAKYTNELTIDEWKELFEKLPRFNYCAWVGGEPLLRQELIEWGKDKFILNEVVTNGTIPIPNWDDVAFFISVDGTKEFHELNRGKGTYDKIKENIQTTSARHLFLNMVITSLNYDCIEEFVSEWSDSKVLWVKFCFYTPFVNGDNSLWIPFEKRNEIIDKTLKPLKEDYGDFIFVSDGILESMKYPNCLDAALNCLASKLVLSLDPMGNVKYNLHNPDNTCYMGAGAICEKCGHMTPHYLKAVYKERDLEIIYKSLRHMPKGVASKAVKSLLPSNYLPTF